MYFTLAGLAVVFFLGVRELLNAWYIREAAVLILAGLALCCALLWVNIRKIHDRSPSAPGFSRGLLVVSGLALIVVAWFLVKGLIGSAPWGRHRPFLEFSAPLVAVGQNIVMLVAWYCYWSRSPRVRETFREEGGRRVDLRPSSIQAIRLGGMLVALTGLACVGAMYIDRQSMYFSWPGTGFFAAWAVFGLAVYHVASSGECRGGKLAGVLAAGLVMLCLLDLASVLMLAGVLGTDTEKAIAYQLESPRSFVLVVTAAALWAAGFRATRPEAAGDASPGWIRALSRSLRSGATWLDAGLVLAACCLLTDWFLGAAVFTGKTYFEAATPSLPQTARAACSAAAGVCAAGAGVGGAVLLLTKPGPLPVFLRAAVTGMFLFSLGEVVVGLWMSGSGEDHNFFYLVQLYQYGLPLVLTLALMTVYAWRRNAVLASGRPAPVILLRGMCWFYAIHGAMVIAAAIVVPLLPVDTSAIMRVVANPWEGASFTAALLADDARWLQGLAAVFVLRATADPARSSLSRLVGWTVALIAIAALGDLVLGGTLRLVFASSRELWQWLERLNGFNPWVNVTPVALAILVFTCSTWDKVRLWYGETRKA